MVIVMRTDLGMDKGKMVAQGAHAAVDAAMFSSKKIVEEWYAEGQRKITLKVGSEQELKDLANKILDEMHPDYFISHVAVIRDFGLTQIPEGSLTCIAFVGKNEDVDKYVSHLKLL